MKKEVKMLENSADVTLSDALRTAIEQFMDMHPRLLEEHHVLTMCVHYTRMFCSFYPAARPYHLRGYRTAKPRRHGYYAPYDDPDPEYYHQVAMVEGYYIDFTVRQLDWRASVPLILTRADVKKEWINVRSRYRELP